MAVESIYAEAFIASLLNDATLLGATALNGSFQDVIFKNEARQGAPYPLVVYDLYDPDDVNSGNGVRMMVRSLYRLRTVGKVVDRVLQDAGRVRVTANRVDDLLNNVRRRSYTVDGVTYNFNVWRERELPPPREEPGPTADIRFRLYGGIYVVEQFA